MSNVVETVFMCLLAINVIFLLLLKCLVWSYSNSDKKQVVLSSCQSDLYIFGFKFFVSYTVL